MPIEITDKIIGLLDSLTPQQLKDLPPVQKRRLADRCRHVARMADPEGSKTQDDIINEAREATAPRSGVLKDLRAGLPRHGG